MGQQRVDAAGEQSERAVPSAQDTTAQPTPLDWPAQFSRSVDPKGARNAWMVGSAERFDARRLVARTIAATSVFAAACLVIVALRHRFKRHGARGRSVQPALVVIDSLVLAPRCCLQLVQVESQKFLVARDGSIVRSVTPVNNFAETLQDVDPIAEMPRSEDLGSVSRGGISLERNAARDFVEGRLGQGRSAPWPGISLER
jgi:flagellar biogenesis protein FliO